MATSSPPSSAHPGILHKYTSHLVAFEHKPTSDPLHTLLFIGGLFDGLLTVPFTPPIASSLPPSWSLAQAILSSSYTGFGSSSLDKDVSELSQCVAYFRKLRPGGKLVLMGHSTGSQDVMHYLVSPETEKEKEQGGRPKIDGGILQSCVSDREGFVMTMPPGAYAKACAVASKMVEDGHGEDILPHDATDDYMGGVISARRWLSLASPGPKHAGQDDYFSSDLSDERLRATFGRMSLSGARISLLYGSEDQYVPAYVDKHALVPKWEGFIRESGGVVDEGSGILNGANHTLLDVRDEVMNDLVGRVVGFCGRVERDGGREGKL